jgi:hypothetical protein
MTTHSDRADELADQAYRELQNALEAEKRGGSGALAGFGREGSVWDRIRVIQAQAQIHASLALKDVVSGRGL